MVEKESTLLKYTKSQYKSDNPYEVREWKRIFGRKVRSFLKDLKSEFCYV